MGHGVRRRRTRLRGTVSGECPACDGALVWGGQDWVPHTDDFHRLQRRWLLRALRDQLERQRSLTEWLEYNEKNLLVGIRWRNGVYPGWQSEERWQLPVEWWDSTQREGDREFILRTIREHLTFVLDYQHGVKVNQATWFHKVYDPRLTRLGNSDPRPICGSSPPAELASPNGEVWLTGDCWCTVAPDHDGLCYCGPCSTRHGSPGWMPQDDPREG